MATFVDYFALLGITRTSCILEIKSAWYGKSLATHPDRRGCVAGTEEWQLWNEKQAQLNAGKEILMDAWKRRAYLCEYDRVIAGPSEYQVRPRGEASCSHPPSATDSESFAMAERLDEILAHLDGITRSMRELSRDLKKMTEDLDRLKANRGHRGNG